jgi:hypothetical protein
MKSASNPKKGKQKPAPDADLGVRPALLVKLMRPVDIAMSIYKAVIWGFVSAMFCMSQLAQVVPDLDLLRALIGMGVTFPILISLALLSRATRSIEVGADGLVIQNVLYRRLLRFGRIERVELLGVEGLRSILGPSVVLHLHGGSSQSISLKPLGSDKATNVFKRIQRAHKAHMRAAGEADTEALAALARRGQSVSDWQAEASHKLRAAADYRSAPLTHEDVERALSSPTAGAERRLGAAMALVGSGDPAARERVRVCAQALVDPKLRVALTSIAEGEVDAEAVEEVLSAERKRSL